MQIVDGPVALRQHQGVDLVENDVLVADDVLHVDRVGVVSIEPRVGRDTDAEGVQLCREQVADIAGQRFAHMRAGDGQAHVATPLRQQDGHAGGDPVAAPVGHQHRGAGAGFVAQHLPGVQHLHVAQHGQVLRAVGAGAGGQQHAVGPLGLDQRAVDAGVATHLDTREADLAFKVGDNAPEFSPVGQQLGQARLPAQMHLGLAQRDPVPPLRGHGGRFHAGRAAAHHQDMLAAQGRNPLAVGQLPSGFGVLDAGDRVPALEAPDAGLVAADAGADVVDRATAGLFGHVGVADQGPRHAAGVGLAFGQHLFGLLRLVDASGHDHRLAQGLPEPRGLGRKVGVRHRHGRHDVDGPAERGRGAGGDAEVVGLGLHRLAGRQDLVGREAAFVPFGRGDAQADDEGLAGLLPDRFEDLFQEAQSAGLVAAVGVIPPVQARVEELGGQVAVAGDDLGAVHAGQVHAARRGAVALDDVPHLGQRQGPRHDAEAFVGADRGRVGHRHQAVAGVDDLPPRVEQLAEHQAALGVAGLGQPAVAVDARVVGGHEAVRGVARRFMYARHLQHDKAGAARRAGPLVGDQRIVHQCLGRQHGVVPGRDDAVLQGDAPDGERGKQVGKHGRTHGSVPPGAERGAPAGAGPCGTAGVC